MHSSSSPWTSFAYAAAAVAVTTAVLSLLGCASAEADPAGPAPTILLDAEHADLELHGNAVLDDGTLTLDGGTGYATVTEPVQLETTESFTVDAWVSIGEAAAPFSDALSQIGATAASFYLGIADGDLAFSMKDADTNEPGHTVRATGPAAEVDPDAWVHLAGVFDAEAGSITLYVNGEQAATTAFASPWQAAGPIVLGGSRAHGAPSGFWSGAITQARITEGAVAAEAITAWVNTSRPVSSPPAYQSDAPADGALEGTWDYVYTSDDLAILTELFGGSIDIEGLGEITATRFGFHGSRWWQGFVAGGEVWKVDGVPEGDGGSFTVDGVILTTDNGSSVVTFNWAIAGDALTLVMTDCQTGDAPCEDAEIVRWMTEHTYTRSGTDASS